MADLIDFTGQSAKRSVVRAPAPILNFTTPVTPGPSQTPLQEATQRRRTVADKIRESAGTNVEITKAVRRDNADAIIISNQKQEQFRNTVIEARDKVLEINANPLSSFFSSLFGNEDADADVQVRIANEAKAKFGREQRSIASEISTNNARKLVADENLEFLALRGKLARQGQTAELALTTRLDTQANRSTVNTLARNTFDATERNRETINELAERKFTETKRASNIAEQVSIIKGLAVIDQNKLTAQISIAKALAVIEQNEKSNEFTAERLRLSQVSLGAKVLVDLENQTQRELENETKIASEIRAEAATLLAGEKFTEAKRKTKIQQAASLTASVLNAQKFAELLKRNIETRELALRTATRGDKQLTIAQNTEARNIKEDEVMLRKLEQQIQQTTANMQHKKLVTKNLEDTGEDNKQTELFTRALLAGFDIRLATTDSPEASIERALVLERFGEIDLTRSELADNILATQEQTKATLASAKFSGAGGIAGEKQRQQQAISAFFSSEGATIVSGTVLEQISSQSKDGSVSVRAPEGGSIKIPADVLRQEVIKRRDAMFARQEAASINNASRIQVTSNFNSDTQRLSLAQSVVKMMGGDPNNGEFQAVAARLRDTKVLILNPASRFTSATVSALSAGASLDSIVASALGGLSDEVSGIIKTGLQNYAASSESVVTEDGVRIIKPNSGNFNLNTFQAATIVGTFLGTPTDAGTFASAVIGTFKNKIIAKTKASNPTLNLTSGGSQQSIINLFAGKTAKATVRLATQEVLSNAPLMQSLNDELRTLEKMSGLGILLNTAVEEFPELAQLLNSAGELKTGLFTSKIELTGGLIFEQKRFAETLLGLEDPKMMERLFELGQDSEIQKLVLRSQSFTEKQLLSAANYALITNGRTPNDEVINDISNFKNFIAVSIR